MEPSASNHIVRADLVATGIFAATATYAAVDFSTPAQWVGAVTAMTLFAIGVFCFLWSYWQAVQRSRTDQIAVSQLYLLLGSAIPAAVRRTMNLALVAQFAIALITTLARPNGPEGRPGSSLAVGFLVPMLGFGLNGAWAALHGTFSPRASHADAPDAHESGSPPAKNEPELGEEIGQNAGHG